MISPTAPLWIIILYNTLLYICYGLIVGLVISTIMVFILRELNYWLKLDLPATPFIISINEVYTVVCTRHTIDDLFTECTLSNCRWINTNADVRHHDHLGRE